MREIELAQFNKEQLNSLLNSKKSFKLLGCSDQMKATVAWLEKSIEGKSMRCRIYTKGRAVAATAGLLAGGSGSLGMVGIGLHRLATMNPDYEIGRDLINHTIEVEYKQD